MHLSWNGHRSLVTAILLAFFTMVSACREAGSARTSGSDVRAREWAWRTISAAESESGHSEIHYKVVHSQGEPVVELRFQVPHGSKDVKVTYDGYVRLVVMSPSEKTYRFSNAELFAKAAEYRKTRYHRLEDFEVPRLPEAPTLHQAGQ